MKTVRKVTSVVVALAMIIAMAATVFAKVSPPAGGTSATGLKAYGSLSAADKAALDEAAAAALKAAEAEYGENTTAVNAAYSLQKSNGAETTTRLTTTVRVPGVDENSHAEIWHQKADGTWEKTVGDTGATRVTVTFSAGGKPVIVLIVKDNVEPEPEPQYINVVSDEIAEDGKWYYYGADGEIDNSFTGLAPNSWGWWYVRNGVVDFSVDDLVLQYGYYWYVRGGHVKFDANTLAHNAWGWWYVNHGYVDASYNGTFDFTPLSTGPLYRWTIVKGQVTFPGAELK